MTKPKLEKKEVVTGATNEEARMNLEEIFLGRIQRAFGLSCSEAEHLECDIIMADAIRTLGWHRLATAYSERRKVRTWYYA